MIPQDRPRSSHLNIECFRCIKMDYYHIQIQKLQHIPTCTGYMLYSQNSWWMICYFGSKTAKPDNGCFLCTLFCIFWGTKCVIYQLNTSNCHCSSHNVIVIFFHTTLTSRFTHIRISHCCVDVCVRACLHVCVSVREMERERERAEFWCPLVLMKGKYNLNSHHCWCSVENITALCSGCRCTLTVTKDKKIYLMWFQLNRWSMTAQRSQEKMLHFILCLWHRWTNDRTNEVKKRYCTCLF